MKRVAAARNSTGSGEPTLVSLRIPQKGSVWKDLGLPRGQLERGHQRDPARLQGTERAGEAVLGVVMDDRADQRDAQLEAVDRHAPVLGAVPEDEAQKGGDRQTEQQLPVGLAEVRDGEHHARDQREVGPELGQELLELGHDEEDHQ
jgi:hypothetical protein